MGFFDEVINRKPKVVLTKFVRFCSGVKNHAWYGSNVGLVRKPIQSELSVQSETIQVEQTNEPKIIEKTV